MTELEERVKEALNSVIDPETGISLVEMGCIRSVTENNGEVTIEFTPTSPFCPMAFFLAMRIRDAVEGVEGVKSVKVLSRGHMMDDQINEFVNRPRSRDEGKS
ncbi:MAG: hypothetical protein DRJ62_04660 [Thermoprotei archaeon]|nr:MAG: hypothetical protein DRJ62_04660 [Thermoprotei archaeon]